MIAWADFKVAQWSMIDWAWVILTALFFLALIIPMARTAFPEDDE